MQIMYLHTMEHYVAKNSWSRRMSFDMERVWVGYKTVCANKLSFFKLYAHENSESKCSSVFY